MLLLCVLSERNLIIDRLLALPGGKATLGPLRCDGVQRFNWRTPLEAACNPLALLK